MKTKVNMVEVALETIPPPPPRYTLKDWLFDSNYKIHYANRQQANADSVLAECERVIDEVGELTQMNKREADHKLDEKINDIEFNKTEIEKQRKEVCLEIDNLTTFNERIKDTMNALRDRCLKICKNCIILREKRLGIELCHDNVEKELLRESSVVQGADQLLNRLAEQSTEQIRRLRSTIYFMDRDLEDKAAVLKIDGHNATLRETSMNLSIYHGLVPLNPGNISEEEWERFTIQNIERAAKEINSARQLRSYVDTLLKQVIEDLKEQYDTVNEAFRKRIEQVKGAKIKLELQHNETLRQISDMKKNITNLEIAISEKEGFMALAHTRLGNRAQRPGIELCKDLVEQSLLREIFEMRENLAKLQGKLCEAHASLSCLVRLQMELERDINNKTNTLQIDEVDCMTIRQSMDYHSY